MKSTNQVPIIDLSDLDLSEKEAAQATVDLPLPQGHVPWIVIDIETIPDESRRHLFGLDKPKEEQKPYVDPDVKLQDLLQKPIDKITEIVNAVNPNPEWIDAMELWEKQSSKPRAGLFKLIQNIRAARAGDGPEAEAAIIKKMSVTPEFLQIIAVGIGTQTQEWAFVAGLDGMTELSLLEWVWRWLERANAVVGYNHSKFDLPSIFVRSILHKIPPARKFDLAPWKNEVVDLMALRYGREQAHGLKKVVGYYGLEIPAEDTDGSKVYDLWQAGKREEIRQYQLSDIVVTRELFKLWRGYFC